MTLIKPTIHIATIARQKTAQPIRSEMEAKTVSPSDLK